MECHSPWGHEESDTAEQLNNKDNGKVMLILLMRSMLMPAEVCGFTQSLSKSLVIFEGPELMGGNRMI